MTLADLRKLSIRKQSQIRFRLRNGMECVISEKGIVKIPALQRRPDFKLEEELMSVTEFLLDSTLSAGKKPERPRTLRREEIAAMFPSSPSVSPQHEHDEE